MVNIGTMAVLGVMVATGWTDKPFDSGAGAEERGSQIVDHDVITGGSSSLNEGELLSEILELDAASGWSFSEFSSLKLNTDYIRQHVDLVQIRELAGPISFYYGVGGRIQLRGSHDVNGSGPDGVRLSVRIPVGLSYTFKENPIELFAQVVPQIDVKPDTEPGIGIGLGARYCFKLR